MYENEFHSCLLAAIFTTFWQCSQRDDNGPWLLAMVTAGLRTVQGRKVGKGNQAGLVINGT